MKMLRKLSPKDIQPTGWLKKQLQLQASGLTGNIAKVFSDLSADNAWLGGKGEAWERGPYYLDGLVPLAFLLNDKQLIQKVYNWIEAILGSKNSSVGFGPLRNVDYWPRSVVQKALISFYRATGDDRVIPFLLEYYHFVLNRIDEFPPYYWASARALEGMEAMLEVYALTKDEVVPQLVEKLNAYSYDWRQYYENFPYEKPMTKYTSQFFFKLGKTIGEPIDRMVRMSQRIPTPKNKKQVTAFNNNKLIKLIMLTHGVNIAMAYKYPLAYGFFKKEQDIVERTKAAFDSVMRWHGLAIGLHSADEHLMGSDASAGVELCAVAEQSYSFEEALRLTKDNFFADMTEYYMFNAYPATFTQDMTAHQYVQQPNQIAADRKPRQFFDTNKEGNIFGIAPNFGCCAANMHQGFPKFAENLVYSDDEKLYFLMFSPFEIKTTIGGKKVNIAQTADYPFENKAVFEVKRAKNQEIVVRIPSFTEKVVLNGKEQEFQPDSKINLTVNSGDIVTLLFSDGLTAFDNVDGSVSIRRNNLLFAMPLEFEERFVRGQRPFHYREFVGDQPFAYAPIIKDGKPDIVGEKILAAGEYPFDRQNRRLEYTVKARRVTNWQPHKNSAQSPPSQPQLAEQVEIPLTPYGCTYLRITQFPKTKE